MSDDVSAELLAGLVPGPTLHWSIGNVETTRVGDWVVPTPREMLVPDITDDQIADNADWAAPYFARDLFLLSFHSFVVRSEGRTIVVDTCLGDDPVRTLPGNPTFLQRLGAEIEGGLDAVDVVLCTHLHFDHVGWNTRIVDGERVPTFPNARYLFGRDEVSSLGADDERIHQTEVKPIVDAGLAELIETTHSITSEVRTVPTTGHTHGHVSVIIESAGRRALITGDVVHSPIQFRYPDLAALADWDSQKATETRRQIIDEHVDTDVLVLGTHFAPPTSGRLRRVNGDVLFESSEEVPRS